MILYNHAMRYYLAVLFLLLALGLPWAASNYPLRVDVVLSAIEQAGSQMVAVIVSHDPRTIAGLQSTYDAAAVPAEPKVRILIVPGHEPDYGGAEYMSRYGDIKERDIAVELGQDLQTFLGSSGRYEVVMARDTQAWNPVLADYFKTEASDIMAWEEAYKQKFSAMIADGSTTQPKVLVDHATTSPGGVLRLYGMTKWANENGIDIEIHIHFNDYLGHGSGPGRYSGFAVYVPAAQYENSSTTHAIADAVFKRLARYNPVSDLPGESAGVVDDPELIALGANDTADAASMLIEYAYIYEPQLDDPAVRPLFVKELAYETYLGLQDFFDPGSAAAMGSSYGTLMLPHSWSGSIAGQDDLPDDVFALQTALLQDGDYPPTGKTISDCPRTGKLGSCTKTALQEFQDKYGITGEKGAAGPKTVSELNQLFSAKMI